LLRVVPRQRNEFHGLPATSRGQGETKAGYGRFVGVVAEGAVVRSRGVRRVMGAIVLAVLAADQVSKSLVLAAHPVGDVGPGWVSVRLVRNTGASGGLASGYPVLVTLAALAITVLAAVFALRARGRVVALALAAVVGGAIGNLSDRLFRAPGVGRGGVVDWIHFGGRGGSMDVADIAIQLGVICAIIAIVAGERVRKAGKARDGGSREAPRPRETQ
jgi:signal peptidase II